MSKKLRGKTHKWKKNVIKDIDLRLAAFGLVCNFLTK